MLLRLPTSVSEARDHLAEGAVPVGGATLVWATWQRDGFPAQAVSLRELPEANVLGPEELGGAVVLNRVDDRVPEVLRRAAGSVGTGAVRRAATVGGNIAGSTLRCLLPAALVLNTRATVLTSTGVYDTDLTEVVAKSPVLLSLRWRTPVASAYHKHEGEPGGPPPLVVASALHALDEGRFRLDVAVREGYEVVSESTECGTDPEEPLSALTPTLLSDVPAARTAVHDQISRLLAP
ncbi:FAD binding domain-containing protein [Streptomyces sp. BK022]|uniref:FAD binding domain-containing protein n=1 Tax=Streptomyces sp. BK022 TaxID=2512123 RepID=UPI001029A0F5|nr:FAD binding domain-containing protein [Streptomyces sp. BK022]